MNIFFSKIGRNFVDSPASSARLINQVDTTTIVSRKVYLISIPIPSVWSDPVQVNQSFNDFMYFTQKIKGKYCEIHLASLQFGIHYGSNKGVCLT